MEPIEQPIITRIGESDIEQAMELSQAAGWNQLPADWRLFMIHGTVFGIVNDRTLVATAAIIPYRDDLAWIGMVLTREDWRGRGYGTTLLKTCIDAIERQGRTAFLDATPAGEPIYLDLGFEPVSRFTRWQGQGEGQAQPGASNDTDAAIKAANAAFGADRTMLLQDFAARWPTTRSTAPDGDAHAFCRDGRLATQIGPVIGQSDIAATDLVEAVIKALDGPVFLDVADDCASLTARLAALGFDRQRPFLRMKKGSAAAPGAMPVIAGPEFG